MERLILMIVIGGLIGYITNTIAVKMLFRPIKPRKLLFFTFQGLLPKRKTTIAESMGATIEEAFLSKETIFESFIDQDLANEFKQTLKTKMKAKLITILPPMLNQMFGSQIEGIIDQYIDQEGDQMIEEMFERLKQHGFKKLNIKELVKTRVDGLDFIAFEQLVLAIVKKELRHIELIGLFLGMIIGALQYIITVFLV